MVKKIIIKYLLIMLIILIVGCWLIYLSLNQEISKKQIIKTFNDNELLFEEVINELENDETISLTKETDWVTINNGITEFIDYGNTEYLKYQKSIQLMKELGIKKITKTKGNVEFNFFSNMRRTKNIIKTNNDNQGTKIKNNWYYVETN